LNNSGLFPGLSVKAFQEAVNSVEASGNWFSFIIQFFLILIINIFTLLK